MEKKSVLEFKDLLTQEGYLYFGHGTGRAKNSEEVVHAIFNEGLRCMSNSLENTACLLHTGGEPSFDPLLNRLDNWGHLNSKKIIIFRFPIQFINLEEFNDDLLGARYYPFYKQVNTENGVKNYVDTRFIVGSYDVETKEFELNPNFKEVLSADIKTELKEKLVVAKNLTKERLSAYEEKFSTSPKINKNNVTIKKETHNSLADFDETNDGWE